MRSSTASALNILRVIMASTLDGHMQGIWVVGPRSEICPEIRKDKFGFPKGFVQFLSSFIKA